MLYLYRLIDFHFRLALSAHFIMFVKEIEQCRFSNWYPLFKRDTFKSVVIPLKEGFVEYLNSDGIVLPSTR